MARHLHAVAAAPNSNIPDRIGGEIMLVHAIEAGLLALDGGNERHREGLIELARLHRLRLEEIVADLSAESGDLRATGRAVERA